jgi:hypothetical protein
MPSKEIQIHIGNLAKINKPALVAYDHSSPIVFAHNGDSKIQACELCEGVVLQLLKHYPPGKTTLCLYEATPSLLFSQIKRLNSSTDSIL